MAILKNNPAKKSVLSSDVLYSDSAFCSKNLKSSSKLDLSNFERTINLKNSIRSDSTSSQSSPASIDSLFNNIFRTSLISKQGLSIEQNILSSYFLTSLNVRNLSSESHSSLFSASSKNSFELLICSDFFVYYFPQYRKNVLSFLLDSAFSGSKLEALLSYSVPKLASTHPVDSSKSFDPYASYSQNVSAIMLSALYSSLFSNPSNLSKFQHCKSKLDLSGLLFYDKLEDFCSVKLNNQIHSLNSSSASSLEFQRSLFSVFSHARHYLSSSEYGRFNLLNYSGNNVSSSSSKLNLAGFDFGKKNLSSARPRKIQKSSVSSRQSDSQAPHPNVLTSANSSSPRSHPLSYSLPRSSDSGYPSPRSSNSSFSDPSSNQQSSYSDASDVSDNLSSDSLPVLPADSALLSGSNFVSSIPESEFYSSPRSSSSSFFKKAVIISIFPIALALGFFISHNSTPLNNSSIVSSAQPHSSNYHLVQNTPDKTPDHSTISDSLQNNKSQPDAVLNVPPSDSPAISSHVVDDSLTFCKIPLPEIKNIEEYNSYISSLTRGLSKNDAYAWLFANRGHNFVYVPKSNVSHPFDFVCEPLSKDLETKLMNRYDLVKNKP